MKIVFVITSSGDAYYCGNCFRDNLMAQAMKKAGHKVIVMPVYLPLKQKELQADTPLFFPATTYYIGEKLFSKHRMPSWMQKLLGMRPLLDLASSMAGTTTSEGMEEMTLSMITGEGVTFGSMVKEMIDWMVRENPDVICLSSTMLLGIAKAMRHDTGLKSSIVCMAQDEEVWIDGLHEADAAQAWRGIAENLKYADAVITTSKYYRRKMHALPGGENLPDIKVVYPGVSRERYAAAATPADPTIGFFYRMNELDGLDILAEAFVLLKQRGTVPRLKLRVGGGHTSQDKHFLSRVRKLLRPYGEDVYMEEAYDWEHHADFYKHISVICVPLRFEESVGLYLLEAFAAGVPAVEPDTGSFAEIVGDAGVIYDRNEAAALADALERMFTVPGLWEQCSEAARKLSEERYADVVSARHLERIITNI